jgi:iron complex transport system ATP-binding protein
VLHDLNLTALYADAITALREGRVVASGRPEAVLTDRVLEAVFDVPLRVGMAPRAGTPFVLPQSVDLGEVASVA